MVNHRVKRSFIHSHDGIRAEQLQPGDMRQFRADLVDGLLAAGLIEVPENAAIAAAPENAAIAAAPERQKRPYTKRQVR